jgi:hypothetical protein
MQAIEFETQICNGTVNLPSMYQHWNGRQVKIIALSEMIEPLQNAEEVFHLLTSLSDDFMLQGRQQPPLEQRETL